MATRLERYNTSYRSQTLTKGLPMCIMRRDYIFIYKPQMIKQLDDEHTVHPCESLEAVADSGSRVT
jgi:hypothetical protein